MESTPLSIEQGEAILEKINKSTMAQAIKAEVNQLIHEGSSIQPTDIFSLRQSDVSNRVFLTVNLDILNDYRTVKKIDFSNEEIETLRQLYDHPTQRIP